MKVTVIGTGYVGLVTGTVFSAQGHEVTCVDIDEKKIARLRRGVLPIYEPGLDEVVESGIRRGTLRFSTDSADASRDADFVFLAVGTPQSEDGAADLRYLEAAAKSVACSIPSNALVVIKSTVPVGTNRKITDLMSEVAGRPIQVANNPEFLREGTALDDCLDPDRIVIGVRNAKAAEALEHLYQPLVASAPRDCPTLVMTPESAEMTKYTANCFLALKISFINQIANLCESLDADVEEVRKGICSDHRIGWEFLKPGVGYGGSCFPKDVRALVSQAEQVDADASMLTVVDETNQRQKSRLFEKLDAQFSGDLFGKRVAIWGLAFKPSTDDIREAPALQLIQALLDAGAQVAVHDPEAMDNVRELFGDTIEYCNDKYDAVRAADALVVVTDWAEYLGVDPGILRWHMKQAVIVDGRNCLQRDWFALADFSFHSIGQPSLGASQPDATGDGFHHVVSLDQDRSETKTALRLGA